MKANRQKITASVASRLRCPQGKAFGAVVDTMVPGFGLRRYSDGSASWFVRAVIQDGSGRRLFRALGGYPALTVEQARHRAAEVLQQLADGVDPREPAPEALTVASLVEQWLAATSGQRSHPRSVARAKHVNAVLGSRAVAALTRAELSSWIGSHAEAPFEGKARALVLKRAAGWAVEEGLLPESFHLPMPKLPADGKRKRRLSPSEVGPFWRACGSEAPGVAALFRALLLTGCRLNELRCATWGEVDVAAGVLRLPAERSKSCDCRDLFLPGPAVEMARALNPAPAPDDPVFQGPRGGFVHHREAWLRIRGAAGLQGVVVHDLRRSARSLMLDEGVDTLVAERALGHTIGGVLGNYAVPSDQSVKEALEGHARRVLALAAERP